MSRSLLKYMREQGGGANLGGDRLFWSQNMQFPFRGKSAPDLKGDEIDETPLRIDFRSGLFRLWVEEENIQYCRIMDRIANGLYIKLERLPPVWSDEHNHYRIYLEWAEVYGEGKDANHDSPFPSRAIS